MRRHIQVSFYAIALAAAWGCSVRDAGIGTRSQDVLYGRDGGTLEYDARAGDLPSWNVLNENDPNAAKYSGVVSVGGMCSGFFVDTHGAPGSPAYVISNGHCIGALAHRPWPAPGEVVTNLHDGLIPNRGVYFNLYAATEPPRLANKLVLSASIPYAIFTGTDLMVVELRATYQELVAAGHRPLSISKDPAAAGEAVEVVGLPGVFSPLCLSRDYCIHSESCKVDAIVDTREGSSIASSEDSQTHFMSQALRVSCSLYAGNSGSPIVSLGSGGSGARGGSVVGVMNSGVEPKETIPGTGDAGPTLQKDCTENRPCEVAAGGSVSLVNANYGVSIASMIGCFDSLGVFDRSIATCRLPSP